MIIPGKYDKMGTPQLKPNGDTLTTKAGEPIYTEYLRTNPADKARLQRHISLKLSNIEAIVEAGYSKVDLGKATYIDGDPRKYSIAKRMEMIRKTITSNKDFTRGYITWFNYIVDTVYLSLTKLDEETVKGQLAEDRVSVLSGKTKRQPIKTNFNDLFE